MPYEYEDYLESIVCSEEGKGYKAVRDEKYKIKEVTKSTYIYMDEADNRIWPEDEILLEDIFSAKRESRMDHDNSEDALTWNVFRGLEKGGLLDKYLSDILQCELTGLKVVYWSYDFDGNSVLPLLKDARCGIGEDCNKGTEPDVLIISEQAIISIEAKLFAGNNVTKNNDKGALNKYIDYNERQHLLNRNITVEEVCAGDKKYELMRNWFLGNEMATNRHFFLLNLVLERKEKDIEAICNRLFANPKGNMSFKRITWEGIYEFILNYEHCNEYAKKIIAYMKNKGSFVCGKRIHTFDIL